MTTLWVRPPRPARVDVVGSWDSWSQPGRAATPSVVDPSWYAVQLDVPRGEYGYLVQIDGVGGLDPREPLTTFRGEQEVSLLRVDDCSSPSLRVERAGVEGGAMVVEATYVAAERGAPIDPASIVVRAFEQGGGAFAVTKVDAARGWFRAESPVRPRGKHEVAIEARGGDGARAEASTHVWVEPRGAWQGGLLYQVLVDRFRGDDGAVLAPPKTPGSRAGGTLRGVQAELERGYFDELGVTALWLSPVYLNPTEARPGKDGRMYEGYHGYWVLSSREVDPRIGGETALRELIAAAHRRGIRVLLDVVPNHVYEANPIWGERRGQGWFHDQGSCVCGDADCPWSEFIERCWFTPYLPDFRLKNADATRKQVDDALFWVKSTGADGVRVDAVPMMPRATTRRIARALRDASPPDDRHFVLGEIFTGPGQGGIDDIRYHIGPDGLDSAFDFPLMWALRGALASGEGGFDEVDAVLTATDEAYEGSGQVRARIIDNHDTSRLLSEIVGDAGGDTWQPAQPPKSLEAYARLEVALGLIMTLPGMPVLFHGDELGVVGKSDPDCRRVFPDVAGLAPGPAGVLAKTRRLGKLRACSSALREGERRSLSVTPDTYVFERATRGGQARVGGDRVVVALSRASNSVDVVVPAGAWVDAMTGETLDVAAGGSVRLEPVSFRVLMSAGDTCLQP